MPYVRSQASYAAFITGRDVDSALHREDGAAGYVVGIVAALRAGDEEITAQEYEAEKAAIQAYNAALPAPAQKVAPDVGGFRLAVFADPPVGVGKAKARALARDYPDSQIGLDQGNWPVVRASLADMLADRAVTNAQYNTIVALMAQYGIPE